MLISAWPRRLLTAALILTLLAGCTGLSLTLGDTPVILHFVYIQGTANYEPLAEEFHRANPDITVVLDAIPLRGNVTNNLTARLAEADALRVPALMASGDLAKTFMPLDSQLALDKNFPIDSIYPGSLDAMKIDGQVLGIPAGLNPFVIFYMPKKFTDAGIELPSPDWKMKDFVQVAKALTTPDASQRGSASFNYGFCTHAETTDPIIFAYLFGGGLFNSLTQNTHPILNAPENVNALTWYAGLKNDLGLVPDVAGTSEVSMMINRGRCGMWMDWMDRSGWGTFGDIPVAMLPLPSLKTPFNVISVDSYAILKTSRNPDAAWKWITFLMSKPGAAGRQIPPFKPEVLANGNMQVAPEIMAIASSLPENTIILGGDIFSNQRFGTVLNLFTEVVKQVYAGQADPQAALDQAQKIAEEAFR